MNQITFYTDNTADIIYEGNTHTVIGQKNIRPEALDYLARLTGDTGSKKKRPQTRLIKTIAATSLIVAVSIVSAMGGYYVKPDTKIQVKTKTVTQLKTIPSRVPNTSGGGLYTCLPEEKGLVCAGKNINSRLGVTDPAERKNQLLADKKITSIATTANTACAGTSTGEIWCWGNNATGIINPAKAENKNFTPTKVHTNTAPITSIVIGAGYAAATDGTHIWSWGNNQYGQITSEKTKTLPVTEITGITGKIRFLHSSGYTTWAWEEKTGYWAWGNNQNKEIWTMPADKHINPTNLKREKP